MCRDARVFIERGLTHALVSALAPDVMPSFRATRCPRTWDVKLNCWRVPVEHLDALTAALHDQLGDDAVLEVARP